ncbi:hypothetical protein XYCOK13_14250 [Xylanibacillus composti]|uniref:YlxR domain-containing protein n=1 Tax=Xylanibacillus composti TaxID=1572762 RepID=A0A8J4M2J4_9BACL|nr:YlxR family protein [Xylanibacillus composti]GIQ68601.1 hypothetical protein XYCOK13_14250 [Xylanibacillus composti]
MRKRRVPLRKCVACQEMQTKRELIRVVRSPEGEIEIDLTGKKPGRGAYLCGKAACFRLAKKSRAFERALKAAVQPEIYDRLEQDFIEMEEEFEAWKSASGDEDE